MVRNKQKLLISVRGPKEAIETARGGAHIADVEFPVSALGTPYPLNIYSVRQKLNKQGHSKVMVSTNIGEQQQNRTSACQAALGVATAGADIIKFGLAELPYKAAAYIGDSTVRSVKKFYRGKKVIPAVFIDIDMRRFFDPFKEGPKLSIEIKADGLLIDTYNKLIGKGLLDYCLIKEIKNFAKTCHTLNKEAWIAGSITFEELPSLWATGIDVICVRAAACEQKGEGRFGEVKARIVSKLVSTIPE